MKISDTSRPSFLVVEDSDEDYAALERVLRLNRVPVALNRCKCAEEVLALLHAPPNPNRPPPLVPALIVLDLNLPGLDGRSVLVAVRQNPKFKSTPVVIFSTSSSPVDIDWCYKNGANSYHVKATGYQSFKQAVEKLVEYWLEAAQLPPKDPARSVLEPPDNRSMP